MLTTVVKLTHRIVIC